MNIFEIFKKKKLQKDLIRTIEEFKPRPYFWPEGEDILSFTDELLVEAEMKIIFIPMDNITIKPSNIKEIREELVKRGYRYDFVTGKYEKKCKSEYEKEEI